MKETLQTSLEEVQQRLSSIDSIAQTIRAKLEDERKNGVPDQKILEENLEKYSLEEEQLTRKIKRFKAICKKRKEEVNHWQNWFSNLDKENKAEEKKQLENEITWRQTEITEQQGKIAELYAKRTNIELEKVEKEVQLEALKQGAFKLPIDQDPRLKGILEEKKDLLKKINFDSTTFNLNSNGQ